MAASLGRVKGPYSEDEKETLISDDVIEELREGKWLEAVYGNSNRLEND